MLMVDELKKEKNGKQGEKERGKWNRNTDRRKRKKKIQREERKKSHSVNIIILF